MSDPHPPPDPADRLSGLSVRTADTLREMHEITTTPRLSLDEQVQGILALGCRQFGLSSAGVTRIDEEVVEVIYANCPGGEIEQGTMLALPETFCGEVKVRAESLAIADVSRSEWSGHPAHEKLGLESYLGSPIDVEGKHWGTLCFFDFKPSARAFTETDVELLRLMAERIQVGLESQAVEHGLRAVLEGTAGVTGAGFFRSMVRQLAEVLGVRHAFVTECLDPAGARARMLAVWWDGAPGEPKEYETEGSPCGAVLKEGVQYYPNGVRRLYPDSEDLESARVEGFVGVPILGSKGEVLGHVAAMHAARIDLDMHQRWILEIFASRAGAEIERLRAERKVSASEQRYQLATKAGRVGVWDLDVESGALFVDSTLEDLLGLAPGEAPTEARTWFELVHPDDREVVYRAFTEHVKGRTPQFVSEHRMLTRDGSIRWVLVRGDAIRDETGWARRVAGTRIDVTERKRLEEEQRELERQIVHSEKLKSLGVLAGGIAHDFNNMLTGILGHTDLALSGLAEDSPIRTRFEKIKAITMRAENLTRQMLAYSGRGAFVVAPIDLNSLVAEMSELLDTAVAKPAELTCEFATDLPAVKADATQVRQVVMNLLMNASDALEGGAGTVTVRTGVFDLTPDDRAQLVVGENVDSGAKVYVEVEDSGTGMSPDTIGRMFDPFFTTKFSGRGLGLSAVHGIVVGHDGGILVDSANGRGSRIRVLFPVSDRPAVAEERPAVHGVASAGGTVLVVDDEASVREVTQNVLESAGMSVLTAADGADALSVFDRHRDEIDIVLLDLTMPRMDGCSAARRIRELAPATPVLLMSGYDERDALQRFASEDLSGFVQKPFFPDALLEQIHAVLEPD